MAISIAIDLFHTDGVKSCMVFYYASMNMPCSYIKEINDFRNILMRI